MRIITTRVILKNSFGDAWGYVYGRAGGGGGHRHMAT